MATVSVGTTSERFGFIQKFGQELGVRYLCDWLGVSPSGYYDWLEREPSRRVKDDIDLLDDIRKAHRKSRGTYGSPRIHRYLSNKGIVIGKNRVARLMRENGLKGRVVTVTQRRPKLRRFQQAGENLRLAVPKPVKCNEQWVADLTYIKVGAKYQYLITIMDVCSRRILGWSLCERRTADDVLPVLGV